MWSILDGLRISVYTSLQLHSVGLAIIYLIAYGPPIIMVIIVFELNILSDFGANEYYL